MTSPANIVHPVGRVGGGGRAFSLLELLVVMGIIGILATLALPAIKNMRGNSVMNTASRQLLDDLGYARLKAIAERTTVYVVFVPQFAAPQITALTADLTVNQTQLQSLLHGQLATYGIFAERRVGAQPGTAQPDYLTEWKTLPEGIFVAQDKFPGSFAYGISVLRGGQTNATDVLPVRLFDTNAFPFPSETNPRIMLPYVAFNSLGQLASGQDELIPLARGSLLLDTNTLALDAIEIPARNHFTNYNVIQVNWITGRGKIQRPEF